MTTVLAIAFWTALALVAYTYVGYGAIVALWLKVRQKRGRERWVPHVGAAEPEVTLVVAAWNEAAHVLDKIRNSLVLDYPAHKLSVLFVTDGSTDGTPDLIRSHRSAKGPHPRVRVIHEPERRGKAAALNRALLQVHTPIVAITDANAILSRDALKHLVKHFADPEVGAVNGTKRVLSAEGTGAASSEGLYWRYENLLKQLDSRLYSMVGAAGELLAFRASLWRMLEEDTVLDDFVTSLRINQLGYRVICEPQAFATELPSATVEDEMTRKVRICAGGFQAMERLRPLQNPLKFGTLAFQYVSHRVMRWRVAPFALAALVPLGAALALASPLYFALAVGQAAFWLWAGLGYLLRKRPAPFRGFFVPFYFAAMNAAALAGWWRHRRGAQSALWARAKRAKAPRHRDASGALQPGLVPEEADPENQEPVFIPV